MKNLAIVAVVAWLLFFNGFSTLRGLVGSSAPAQTIIQGAARVVQTVQPAAQPRPAQQVNVSRPLIQVERMPVLPTATPQPEPTAASGEFWTPLEQTAIAAEATATSEAFYDPNTIAPAPEAFTDYAHQACADAAVKSPLCP